MSIAIATNLDDRLSDLGNVPLARVRNDPMPGTATVEDVVHLRVTERKLYELVDATLVEKAMGWQESLLAGVLLHWLYGYLDHHNLGVATGPDGMTRLFGDTVRAPDVAFIAWSRLTNGRLPEVPVPDLVPNFVIEILSVGNTYAEMSRKRREYFHAGVQLLWMVDHRSRTVTAFRSTQDARVFGEGEQLDGGTVLPGWKVEVSELFRQLDRTADKP